MSFIKTMCNEHECKILYLSNSSGYFMICFWFFDYKLMDLSTFAFWIFNNLYSNISNSADPDQKASTGQIVKPLIIHQQRSGMYDMGTALFVIAQYCDIGSE